MKNSFCFFSNFECENFPCHRTEETEDFNCMFCFCPLYHLEDCGGEYAFTGSGIKDCSNCLLPHKAESYGYIVRKLSGIV